MRLGGLHPTPHSPCDAHRQSNESAIELIMEPPGLTVCDTDSRVSVKPPEARPFVPATTSATTEQKM